MSATHADHIEVNAGMRVRTIAWCGAAGPIVRYRSTYSVMSVQRMVEKVVSNHFGTLLSVNYCSCSMHVWRKQSCNSHSRRDVADRGQRGARCRSSARACGFRTLAQFRIALFFEPPPRQHVSGPVRLSDPTLPRICHAAGLNAALVARKTSRRQRVDG